MITLCLTHYNRFELLCEAISQVKDDKRIERIVISDDQSTDGSYEKLVDHFWEWDSPRIVVYRNKKNLDCYFNKYAAVERAQPGSWVILLDSDNIISKNYIDTIVNQKPWFKCTAFLPVFAQPHFDYRAFSGVHIDKTNVARYMDKPHFATALNTANHFFHRDEYLKVFDASVNPNTNDSLYQNYRWLAAGNSLFFVPGLQYFHRVHSGSHFKHNNNKLGTEEFRKNLINKLKSMT